MTNRSSLVASASASALRALFCLTAITGCGGSEDGGGGGGGGGGPDAGAVGGDPDATPQSGPYVESASPADGATGVESGKLLVVRFSEPMNTASVEAAFTSPGLANVDFQWNDAGDILNIIPQGGLVYAQGFGNDPSTVTPISYDYQIADTATSADGEPLAGGFGVSFTTMREMQTVMPLVNELTRTRLQNGVLHSAGTASMYVGDSDVAIDQPMRWFITFDLTELPDSTIELAYLLGSQEGVTGAPYEDLGNVVVDHVSFTAVDETAWSVAPHAELGVLSDGATAGTRSLVVTAALQDDLDHRGDRGDLSQYRVKFPLSSDGDGSGDSARFSRSLTELSITYLVP